MNSQVNWFTHGQNVTDTKITIKFEEGLCGFGATKNVLGNYFQRGVNFLIACENSHPSSLPPRVKGRLFTFHRLISHSVLVHWCILLPNKVI